MIRVCHITSVHKSTDTRILYKECVSLAENNFEVHLIAPNSKERKELGVQIHNVENKAGHLEKKEYYCHKCEGMMTEHSDTYYKCESCEIKYDLRLYKYIDKKWTRKFARRKDYPIIS